MPSAGRTGRLCYSALAALLFHIGLASSLFPMLPHWHFRPQLLPDGSSPRRPGQPLRHSAPAIIFQMALRRGALASTCPGQHLPRPAPAPASSSTSAPGQSSRRPASNKPHSAEKSTPVWLAIWRTWAGFANSQRWCVAFRCTYSYICTHPRYCHFEPLLRQTRICRPICPDFLRHLRISAE